MGKVGEMNFGLGKNL